MQTWARLFARLPLPTHPSLPHTPLHTHTSATLNTQTYTTTLRAQSTAAAGVATMSSVLAEADTALRSLGQKQLITIILEFMKVMSLSVAWFCISISLVFFNRWLFHSWNGGWCVVSCLSCAPRAATASRRCRSLPRRAAAAPLTPFTHTHTPPRTHTHTHTASYRFAFPVMLTAWHMTLKGGIALTIKLASMIATGKPLRSLAMPWRTYLRRALPIGITTSLDIALSNMGMQHLSISSYTVCKTTGIIFVMFMSFALKLQEPDTWLVLSVVAIFFGVALFSASETEFLDDSNVIGMLCVLAASLCGAVRWTLTQVSSTRAIFLKRYPLPRRCDSASSHTTPPPSLSTQMLVDTTHNDAQTMKQLRKLASVAYANVGSALDLRWTRNRVTEQVRAQRDDADGATATEGMADFEAPNVAGVGVVSTEEARTTTVGGLIAREEGDEEEDATAHADVLEGVLYLTPSAILVLLPYALVVETPIVLTTLFKPAGDVGAQSAGTWLLVPIVGCIGGIMAFALIFIEMQLVKATSSLAVSVIGNVKDSIQIFLALTIGGVCIAEGARAAVVDSTSGLCSLGETMTLLKVIGILITMSGATSYAVFKGRAKVLAIRGESAQPARPDEPPKLCGRELPPWLVAALGAPRRLVAKLLALCGLRNGDAYGTVGGPVGGMGGAVQFRSEEQSVMMSQVGGGGGSGEVATMDFDGAVPPVPGSSGDGSGGAADGRASSFSIGDEDEDDAELMTMTFDQAPVTRAVTPPPAADLLGVGGGGGGGGSGASSVGADLDSMGEIDTPPASPMRGGGGAFAMDEEEDGESLL